MEDPKSDSPALSVLADKDVDGGPNNDESDKLELDGWKGCAMAALSPKSEDEIPLTMDGTTRLDFSAGLNTAGEVERLAPKMLVEGAKAEAGIRQVQKVSKEDAWGARKSF